MIHIHFRRPCVAFLLLLSLSAAHAQTADSIAAMVTNVTGSTWVTEGSARIALELGMDMRVGATVAVESGNASFVFQNGEFIELKKNDEFRFGKNPAASAFVEAGGTRGVGKDEAVQVSDNSFTLSDEKKRLYQLANVSSIRGEVMVIPVSPRLVVTDGDGMFVWFDSDSAAAGREKTYTIVVKDEAGSVVSQKDVDGKAYQICSANFSDAAAGMRFTAEKHFTWSIHEQSKPPAGGSLSAPFVVADEQTLAKSAAARKKYADLLDDRKIDENSFHMLHALYDQDDRERLFADALPHLLHLAAQPSGASYSVRAMASIFQRFGNQVSVVAGCLPVLYPNVK